MPCWESMGLRGTCVDSSNHFSDASDCTASLLSLCPKPIDHGGVPSATAELVV